MISSGPTGRATQAARRMIADDRAASMVEYALMVALIALIAFVAVRALGQAVRGAFS